MDSISRVCDTCIASEQSIQCLAQLHMTHADSSATHLDMKKKLLLPIARIMEAALMVIQRIVQGLGLTLGPLRAKCL